MLRVGPDLERSVRRGELNEKVVVARARPAWRAWLGRLVAIGVMVTLASDLWRQHDAAFLVSVAVDALTLIGAVALVGVTIGIVVSVWQRRRASTPDAYGYSRRVVWVAPLAAAADMRRSRSTPPPAQPCLHGLGSAP
jgi:hypothetical protein